MMRPNCQSAVKIIKDRFVCLVQNYKVVKGLTWQEWTGGLSSEFHHHVVHVQCILDLVIAPRDDDTSHSALVANCSSSENTEAIHTLHIIISTELICYASSLT